jgi:hypothetical protein
MSIEFGGVAAFVLRVGTLPALERNGTLVDDELADIVDQSLVGLKSMDAEMSVPSQDAWRSAVDLLERKFWGDYMRAFEQTIRATSSTHAPW